MSLKYLFLEMPEKEMIQIFPGLVSLWLVNSCEATVTSCGQSDRAGVPNYLPYRSGVRKYFACSAFVLLLELLVLKCYCKLKNCLE